MPPELSNSVPILLLPPSEGKATGGKSGARSRWTPDRGAFGRLEQRRVEVIEALGAAGGGDEKLLGVKGEHLARALDANTSVVGAPTLPAWQRYTGVVWDHLDPATLTAAQRKRVLVISGLAGVVRSDDPLPDYRLKMGANLAPLGKLSTWWRPAVTETLDRYARGRTDGSPRVLVDLLPQEHRAAWSPSGGRPVVSIELVDPTGKPGGHFAKAAKGELARAILTEGFDAVDGWHHDRFELEVTLS